nr:hypothetical protein [Pseudomonas otitidis]
MEVWVESVDVVDRRNLAYERVYGGVAGYAAKTEGWWGGRGLHETGQQRRPAQYHLRALAIPGGAPGLQRAHHYSAVGTG